MPDSCQFFAHLRLASLAGNCDDGPRQSSSRACSSAKTATSGAIWAMKISALPALACRKNERLRAARRLSQSCQEFEQISAAADNTSRSTMTAAGPTAHRRSNRQQIEDRRVAVNSNAWHWQELLLRLERTGRVGKRPFLVYAGVPPRRSGTYTARPDCRPPIRPRRTRASPAYMREHESGYSHRL